MPPHRRRLQTADWAFIVVVIAAYVSLFTAAEVAFTRVARNPLAPCLDLSRGSVQAGP